MKAEGIMKRRPWNWTAMEEAAAWAEYIEACGGEAALSQARWAAKHAYLEYACERDRTIRTLSEILHV